MSINKRFYWLKIGASFFDDLKIQKLRKIAGGDTFTCIYLKLMILSLKNDGSIFFESIFEDIEDELAIKLNETVENIKATLVFCKSMKMIEIYEDKSLFFKQIKDITGSETESTVRSRRSRASNGNKKPKMLQCNKNATAEKEKELDNKKKLTKKSNFDLTNFKFYKDEIEFWDDWNTNQIKKAMSNSKLEELNQASKENRLIGF
ncbi:phage replisome organizer N-terminal domain-containing protein [Aliarcobacter trophiarum]|uniref:phage replisome organizer N-terminal domain-containing protein n=1 Tax=Aliarcobacter trophiarum TaxID=708186 RepID=UPI00100B95B3|nr:phage replisome organizer N-terminal domain-containing protein [Aliarcobacter trophiarum]RXI27653.1 hypothetical protein CRU89_05085 [Aliarcobacter trophiarum]